MPFIGPWLASLFFGGEFPTPDLISRLFVIHVLFLPALRDRRDRRPRRPRLRPEAHAVQGPRPREDNVVGLPFWPAQTFRSIGLLFLTAAVVVLIGGLFQINPVWIYGPYVPSAVSAPAQPDWYIGWLEGALRLGPAHRADDLRRHDPGAVRPGRLAARARGHGARRSGRSSRRGSPTTTASTTCSTGGGRCRGGPRPGPRSSRCSWSPPSRAATTSWPCSSTFPSKTLTRLFQVRHRRVPVVTWLVVYVRSRATGADAAGQRREPCRDGRRPWSGRATGGFEEAERAVTRPPRRRLGAAPSPAVAVAVAGCFPTPATDRAGRSPTCIGCSSRAASSSAAIVWGLATIAILRYRRRGDAAAGPDPRQRAARDRLDGDPAGDRARAVRADLRDAATVDATSPRPGVRDPRDGVPLAVAVRLHGRRRDDRRAPRTEPRDGRAGRRADPRHARRGRRHPRLLRAARSCSSATRSRVTRTAFDFRVDAPGRLPGASAPSSAASSTTRCCSRSAASPRPEFDAWLAQQRAAPAAAGAPRSAIDGRARTAATDAAPLVRAGRTFGPRRRGSATTDHKRIGILYIVTAFAFFLVGGPHGRGDPAPARRSPDQLGRERVDLRPAVHDPRHA